MLGGGGSGGGLEPAQLVRYPAALSKSDCTPFEKERQPLSTECQKGPSIALFIQVILQSHPKKGYEKKQVVSH